MDILPDLIFSGVGKRIVIRDWKEFPSRERGKRLRPGDRVGIVAPSGPVDSDSFRNGLGMLKGMGLEPVFSGEILRKNGYLAGPDRVRADELLRYYRDPGIRAIWCARGGYGSLRVLPYLNWKTIRSHPKILVGYSDVTALLAAVYRYGNQIVFHGPMVSGLTDISEFSRFSIAKAIFSGEPLTYDFPDASVLKPGTATGPVVAGNLTMLNHLLKTPFELLLDGVILILEEVNEALYRIDRMLTQMKLAGYLRRIRGLILGGFERCAAEPEIHHLFLDQFQDMDIPILAGCPFGHGRDNWMIPMGLAAAFCAEERWLRFAFPATEGETGKDNEFLPCA